MKRITLVLSMVIVVILVFSIITILFIPGSEDEETIALGALLPLTGNNAVYGIEIQNAIELAKDEINAAGGIQGKSLTIIYEDDQANPSIGVNAMQKLITVDEVPVVFGSWVSGVVLATAPLAEEHETIVMASAISPDITHAGGYIFRMQPSATFYTKEAARYVKQTLQYQTVGIIYIHNEFGKAVRDAFVTDFESYGGNIVGIESYFQEDNDFRSQLLKLKQKQPQTIFVIGYQETFNLIQQMKELDINAQIIAMATFQSQSTLESLGDLAETVVYPYHFVAGASHPEAMHYEQAYLATYGEPTGGFAPLMYDATHIIAHVLSICAVDTECMKEELYNIKHDGVVGPITFDEHGDPSLPIIMKTVRNGEFVKL